MQRIYEIVSSDVLKTIYSQNKFDFDNDDLDIDKQYRDLLASIAHSKKMLLQCYHHNVNEIYQKRMVIAYLSGYKDGIHAEQEQQKNGH